MIGEPEGGYVQDRAKINVLPGVLADRSLRWALNPKQAAAPFS